MSENHKGLKSLLEIPVFYELFHTMVGARVWLKNFVNEEIKPVNGQKLLDVGCGPAEIVKLLPEGLDYIGVDHSEAYIKSATKKFGNRAKFICDDLTKLPEHEIGEIDIAVAIGLTHHLEDEEVELLLKNVSSLMKPESRFFIVDVCYFDGQSPIVKYIISQDRGENIRHIDEYMKFATNTFSNIKQSLHYGFLPFPHSALILECKL